MIIKLAIIGAVVLIGVITFASELQELFPNTTSTGVNSLKSDMSALASESIQTAEQTIDSSVEKAETKFSEIKQNSTNYVEENIVDKIPFLNEEDKS